MTMKRWRVEVLGTGRKEVGDGRDSGVVVVEGAEGEGPVLERRDERTEPVEK
jgi:hypothetical protein